MKNSHLNRSMEAVWLQLKIKMKYCNKKYRECKVDRDSYWMNCKEENDIFYLCNTNISIDSFLLGIS